MVPEKAFAEHTPIAIKGQFDIKLVVKRLPLGFSDRRGHIN
jgi:hypothetical protein